jgi:alkylated DNA repair dioxygenase AlkB
MMFPPVLPEGMRYQEDYLSADEESALLARINELAFSAFEMHGAVAKRRVAFFGQTYDVARPAAPLPEFLLALRPRLSEWAGVAPDAFAMALINEYPPGAPIGWHRDAPQYGVIAGVSLLSSCRMRLRPYVSPSAKQPDRAAPRRATHELVVVPRSCYLLAGEARRAYEHSIPPVKALRYSITFRTLRR